MPKQIVKSALSALIAIGISHIAIAETPPEVAESYEAYKSAVLSLNQEKAEQSALAAWEAAEESLGNTKVTGDLAQNYADIAVVSKSNFKNIERAYKRSIELASHYPDDEALTIRMDRTISLASIMPNRDLYSKSMRGLIKGTLQDVESANVEETTFLADIYTLQALVSYQSRNFRAAKQESSRAVAIYAEAHDDLSSPYRDIAEKLATGNSSLYPSWLSSNTQQVAAGALD